MRGDVATSTETLQYGLAGESMIEQPDNATYDAYLLRYPDGSWLAQLTDLPGAYARGATQGDAMARLTAAIPAYYAWLTQHDEYTPILRGSPTVTSREAAEAPVSADKLLSVFFSGDAEPVTDEDLDWWLAALDWTYGDMEALALRTPRSPRTPQHMLLGAIALTQLRVVSHATGAQVDPASAGSDPLMLLDFARKRAAAEFRRTKADQRAAVREVDGQRWSVRRGLRESALVARQGLDDLAALQARG